MITEKQAIVLFDDYLKESLSEENAVLLLEYLKENPRFGQESLDNLSIDYLLRRRKPISFDSLPLPCSMDELARQAAERAEAEMVRSPAKIDRVANRPAPRSRREFHKGLFLIALLLGLVVLAVYIEFRPTDSATSTTANPRAIARITDSVEAEWETEPVPPGRELEPCRLKLRSGVVKLEFGDGAEVLLEGPTELLVKGRDLAFCQHGKLSVFVPPRAVGFEVASPTATVIDRGTAFSLSVDDHRTDVHVLTGKVEVNRAGSGTHFLDEGVAALFELGGEVKEIRADPETFFSESKFQDKKVRYVEKRRPVWTEQLRRQENDPSLIYRFEPDKHAGIAKVEGSRNERTAVSFRHSRDRIRFTAVEECPALTMIASVRLHDKKHFANTLIMGDSFQTQPGRFHWQINRFGSLQFHLNEGDSIPRQYTSSPVAWEKSWMTVALVADPVQKTITHYFEGKPVGVMPWSDPQPLRVGSATFGNEFQSNSKRFFRGDIEECWIFSRALTNREIEEFYHNNR